jgi:hypothetical protein
MSLELNTDSYIDGQPVDDRQRRLVASCSVLPDGVRLWVSGQEDGSCELQIGPQDMLWLVKYWLTNVDLGGEADTRCALVRFVRQLRVVPGFGDHRARYALGAAQSPAAAFSTAPERERVIQLDPPWPAEPCPLLPPVEVAIGGREAETPQLRTMAITLRDPAPPDGLPAEVRGLILVSDSGVSLEFVGYGECEAAPGYGQPVYLEYYAGSLALLVWDDINDAEPTRINLEGARESRRRASGP